MGSTQETANDFSAWTGTTGTPAVTQDVAHHGADVFDYTPNIFTIEDSYYNWAGGNTFYAGAYFRFPNLNEPTGGTTNFAILLLGKSGGNLFAEVRPKTDRWTLVYRTNAGQFTSDWMSAPALDTWYWVEIKVVRNAGAGEARLYIDGTERVTQTNLTNDTVGATIDEYRVGSVDFCINVATQVVYADCAVLADSGPIGVEGAGGVSIPVIMAHRRSQGMS